MQRNQPKDDLEETPAPFWLRYIDLLGFLFLFLIPLVLTYLLA
jgi:hypothetical protein